MLRELGSDKDLCPLGSGDEGSFVTVKLYPPPFLVGVPLSPYTGGDLQESTALPEQFVGEDYVWVNKGSRNHGV